MRYRIALAAASAFMLIACGGGDDGSGSAEGLSDEEIAERAEQAIRMEPGQYRTTVQLVSVDIPGAPPEVVDMMKQAMSGENATHEYCLTPEEADKGFEQMARNSAQGDCTVQRFDVDGGDIDAVMTCKSADGSEGRMTLEGTGTSTSSDMTMTMETEVPGMGEGSMVMRASHERIGDCAA